MCGKDYRKYNDKGKKIKGRNLSNRDLNWVPERKLVTGFTFKGILVLLAIIGLGIIIRNLFF